MESGRTRSFRFDDEKIAYRAASAIRDLNDSAVWEVRVVSENGGALLVVPDELWTRRSEVAEIVSTHGGHRR
jgi:hypothetical protein